MPPEEPLHHRQTDAGPFKLMSAVEPLKGAIQILLLGAPRSDVLAVDCVILHLPFGIPHRGQADGDREGAPIRAEVLRLQRERIVLVGAADMLR